MGDDIEMQNHQIAGTNFGFSAVGIDDLGASEYTLVGVVVDATPSVSGFEKEMEAAVGEVVKSCQHSPRADNLMLRVTTFNSGHDSPQERHGFKPLEGCNPDDYQGMMRLKGITALFDASCEMIEALVGYGETLVKADYECNAILFVITDGMDNDSTLTRQSVAQAVDKAVKSEMLESIVTVLIGVNVNDPHIGQYLTAFRDEAQFSQYVECNDASSRTLAKLAEFVSKSISSQSQALGTGGPSQTLQF